MPRYTIRENRIRSGFLKGFTYDAGTGVLSTEEEYGVRYICLKGLDGMEKEARWGRLSFDIEAGEEVISCAYVMAVDKNEIEFNGKTMSIDDFLISEEIARDDKGAMLKKMGAKRFVGQSDILLYDLSGRYLFLVFDFRGEGMVSVSNIVVDSTGDNFMATFPEIYKERNSFFHRYISVFSSIYNDFQRMIDNLPDILDLESCPVEMLIEYGSWMGIDLRGGFLPEDVIRDIVREAYELNKMKGTRKGIKRLLSLILKEEPVVIEHNLVRAWLEEEDNDEYPEDFKPKGVYDVTILIHKRITEELRHQIIYMLNQFIPVRTRIIIAQMDENVIIDSNTYLDINSKLPEEKNAVLDGSMSLDGTVVI